MTVLVAETLLGLLQAARLINTLVDQYQKGRITQDQFLQRAVAMRIDIETTEAEWKALEERDAKRGTQT